MTSNKQLHRTVIRRRWRAASAPLHHALAARRTGQRAAAGLRRYARMALALLACASMAPLWAIAAPPTMVGLRLPPYPDDCKVSEGAVLGAGPPYRLVYEHLVCRDRDFVILQRVVERQGAQPTREVVDEVRPYIPPEHRLWGVLPCRWVLGSDEPVFAVGTSVKVTNTRFLAEKLIQAWRFDLEAERIKPILASDVSCEWENSE